MKFKNINKIDIPVFVDFIEEAVPGKSACGYKNFTFNEWFFLLILKMNLMFQDLFKLKR